MQHVSFKVTGKVRGQARPRFTGYGKRRRKTQKYAYEDEQSKAYKKAIAKAYKEAANGVFFETGAVRLLIRVYRKMPAAYKGKSESDVYKPDVDNIAKAVMDALNGVAYADDKQVTQLVVTKAWRVKALDHEYLNIDIESGV